MGTLVSREDAKSATGSDWEELHGRRGFASNAGGGNREYQCLTQKRARDVKGGGVRFIELSGNKH
jgi:hypothetical protein